MKNYIHIFWCILYFTACHESSDKSDFLVIPVDVNQNYPVRLSEISEEIQKVELETSDECLIKFIEQVLLADDRIFVLDVQGGGTIHVFDSFGKFRFAINRKGQGPGEYTSLSCIAIDTKNKHIYAAAQFNQKIIRFDFDGSFIDEHTKMGYIENIIFEEDILYVFSIDRARQTGDKTYITTSTLTQYNRDWQPIDTFDVNIYKHESNSGSVKPNLDFISKDKQNNLYMYYPDVVPTPKALQMFGYPIPNYSLTRDTLYKLDTNHLSPYAKLKFSNENNNVRNKNIAYIHHTSNLLISKYFNFSDDESNLFCYDFKSQIGKNMKGGFLDDMYNSGLTEIRLLNSQFFYYVKAVEDIHVNEQEPNPILYIGKFKE